VSLAARGQLVVVATVWLAVQAATVQVTVAAARVGQAAGFALSVLTLASIFFNTTNACFFDKL